MGLLRGNLQCRHLISSCRQATPFECDEYTTQMGRGLILWSSSFDGASTVNQTHNLTWPEKNEGATRWPTPRLRDYQQQGTGKVHQRVLRQG